MEEKNVLIFNVGSSSLSSKVFCCNPNAADSHSVVVRTVVGAKGHRVMTKSTEKPFIEYKDATGHCIGQEESNERPSSPGSTRRASASTASATASSTATGFSASPRS